MSNSININLESGRLVFTYGVDTTSKSKALVLLFLKYNSWWFNPKFGNKIYILTNKPKTDRTANIVKQAIEQALQSLLDRNIVKNIEIITEEDRIDAQRVNSIIKITEIDGNITEIPLSLSIT